jgi:hypothetical protein
VQDKILLVEAATSSTRLTMAASVRSASQGPYGIAAHGGLRYSRPARVTPELLAELEALVPLAAFDVGQSETTEVTITPGHLPEEQQKILRAVDSRAQAAAARHNQRGPLSGLTPHSAATGHPR